MARTRELAVVAFKLKYEGSILGYVWTLIKPLMIFGMMYAVFALFLLYGRATSGNFPVQLLLGIVIWTFFADATSTALAAFVSNADMIRKTSFPRWILVIAAVLSSTMTLAVNLGLLVVIGIALHFFSLGWYSWAVLPVLLELCAFTVGVSLILATLYVSYRDLIHVWDVGLQVVFWGSAVVFPLALIPPKYLQIVAFNPMAQMLEDLRRSVVTTQIPWSAEILGRAEPIPLAIVAAVLGLGVGLYRRRARWIGERV
jgi:ABC-2 type transport system permease protein